MNKTAQAMLGLTFLSTSFGAVVGYHHTNLREQRGKDIETLSNGALTYVPATLPFLDNGYLEGVATPKETSCQSAQQRYYYICTTTFVEFEEPEASLKVYVPIKGEKSIDELLAAGASIPAARQHPRYQMLETLADAQKLQMQVSLKATPNITSNNPAMNLNNL